MYNNKIKPLTIGSHMTSYCHVQHKYQFEKGGLGEMDLLTSLNGLNVRVNKLNANRNVQLGKKEQLEKQLEKAMLEYKDKFGVDLTEVDINAEYTSVLNETQQSASFLEQVLQAVESGDYATAEGLLQGKFSEEESSVEQSDVVSVGAETVVETTPVIGTQTEVPSVQVEVPVQTEVPIVTSALHTEVPVVPVSVQPEVPVVSSVEQHIEVEQKATPRLKSRLQSSEGVPPAPSVNKSASGGFKFVPTAPINVGTDSDDGSSEDTDSDSTVPSFNGLLRGTAFQPNGGK